MKQLICRGKYVAFHVSEELEIADWSGRERKESNDNMMQVCIDAL
jgi:hypothetical protein